MTVPDAPPSQAGKVGLMKESLLLAEALLPVCCSVPAIPFSSGWLTAASLIASVLMSLSSPWYPSSNISHLLARQIV